MPLCPCWHAMPADTPSNLQAGPHQQVLPIWEGTTSVQALDVLRVLSSSPQAAAAFTRRTTAQLEEGEEAAVRAGGDRGRLLGRACSVLSQALPAVSSLLHAAVAAGPGSAAAQVGARDLAFAMARLYVGGERSRPAGLQECCLLDRSGGRVRGLQGGAVSCSFPFCKASGRPASSSLSHSAAGGTRRLEWRGRACAAGS